MRRMWIGGGLVLVAAVGFGLSAGNTRAQPGAGDKDAAHRKVLRAGYCKAPGQCDPTNEDKYRTVSDISLAMDDEGNAYANVLDAPGGTLAFTGFNMTAHIKKRGHRSERVSRKTLAGSQSETALANDIRAFSQRLIRRIGAPVTAARETSVSASRPAAPERTSFRRTTPLP